MSQYRSDDIVTTRDGVRYRVIYQAGEKVFAKPCDGKSAKGRMIECAKIIHHEPKKVSA